MDYIMNKGDYLSALLRSPKSVFSVCEVAIIWGEVADVAFRKRLNYYVKNKKLHTIRRGLYAKDREYDKLELAVRVMIPAYVSFETVLGQAGVIFQKYETIFITSYRTREIKIEGQIYSFRKIKDEILFNPAGIVHTKNRSVASPERAFLDSLYLNHNYHFDNLSALNQKKVFGLLPIYSNKRMEKAVHKLFKILNDKT